MMESKACPCGRVLYEDVRHCPSCGRPMGAARRATAEEKRTGVAVEPTAPLEPAPSTPVPATGSTSSATLVR